MVRWVVLPEKVAPFVVTPANQVKVRLLLVNDEQVSSVGAVIVRIV